jgi:glycosyltransferase involved in cell wall biosynthesis
MSELLKSKVSPASYSADALRLEGVTVSVGFSDLLEEVLKRNHAHFDQLIVVTSHADTATQQVARKYGTTVVVTDLFNKNGRSFNKGAAINAGFDYFQYYGWRIHLDSDIILPDNFRRVIFNHTSLEQDCLYGADRVNIIGSSGLAALDAHNPQHMLGMMLNDTPGPIGHRWVDNLRGYCPLGFFQLYHSSKQRPYPYSLGTAAHDDLMFSALWPQAKRLHLPSVVCYHLCSKQPVIGENWDGNRKMPTFK